MGSSSVERYFAAIAAFLLVAYLTFPPLVLQTAQAARHSQAQQQGKQKQQEQQRIQRPRSNSTDEEFLAIEVSRLNSARESLASAIDPHHLTAAKYSDEDLLTALKNQHLVMIGDSLMRYQYMSLVYALEHDYTYPASTPNPLREGDFKSIPLETLSSHKLGPKDKGWPAYMVMTNAMLNGNEVCDCARTDSAETSSENRYYSRSFPDGGEVRVSFFKKQTDQFKGHTFTNARLDGDVYSDLFLRNFTWTYPADEFIAKLIGASGLVEDTGIALPRPTVILYNEGIWNSGNVATLKMIAKGLSEGGAAGPPIRTVWKTTTRGFQRPADYWDAEQEMNEAAVDFASSLGYEALRTDELLSCYVKVWPTKEHSEAACEGGNGCKHKDWIRQYPEFPEFYWDMNHFQPMVYTSVNRQFLQLLKEGQIGSYRMVAEAG